MAFLLADLSIPSESASFAPQNPRKRCALPLFTFGAGPGTGSRKCWAFLLADLSIPSESASFAPQNPRKRCALPISHIISDLATIPYIIWKINTKNGNTEIGGLSLLYTYMGRTGNCIQFANLSVRSGADIAGRENRIVIRCWFCIYIWMLHRVSCHSDRADSSCHFCMAIMSR